MTRDKLSEEELRDLLLEALIEVEREQEDKGNLTRSGQDVLTRFQGFFELLGAVQLGFLVACLTVLANFVVVRMLFHLDLSRYLS